MKREFQYYFLDEVFNDATKFIEFFVSNESFRNDGLSSAANLGTNNYIFRGQPCAEPLFPKLFRDNQKELLKYLPSPFTQHTNTNKNINEIELARILYDEVSAVILFLESADCVGLNTPLHLTSLKEHLEEFNALVTNNDADLNADYPNKYLVDAIALAQHHGVPTRFLDFTEYSLIAAYFAAYKYEHICDDDYLVVYILSVHQSLEKELQIIKPTRFGNPNMLAQKGIFVNIRSANKYFMGNGEFPSIEDILEQNQLKDILGRVRLIGKQTKKLLQLLYGLGIYENSMMPSLDNSANSIKYLRRIFDE